MEDGLGMTAAVRVAEGGSVGPALVQVRALCAELRAAVDVRCSMLELKRESLAAWGWLPIHAIGHAQSGPLSDIEVEQLLNTRRRLFPLPHFKAYVLRFLPRVPSPTTPGEWTTTTPGYEVRGTRFQLEGQHAVSGWEGAEGVLFRMEVDENEGIRPTLVLKSDAVQPPVTFQLHILINERGAAEFSGAADADGGFGVDFHNELLLCQTGMNGIQLGAETPNFHVPSLGGWQSNNPLMRTVRQNTTLAVNGTFSFSPGSGQYFCQGHSTLMIVVCADLTRGIVLAAPPSVRDGEEWHDNGWGDGQPRERINWENGIWQVAMARAAGTVEQLMDRFFPDGLRSATAIVHERFR